MVCKGLIFNKMYELLEERTLANFNLNKEKYILDCQLDRVVLDQEKMAEIRKIYFEMLIQSDTLEDLFKFWFKRNERCIKSSMSSLN